MRKIAMLVSVGALYAVLPLGFAQENMSSQAPKPPEHYYRLNLTVEQMNDAGKVTNTRSFVASVTTNGNWTQSIRTGERVPVQTSSEHTEPRNSRTRTMDRHRGSCRRRRR